MQRTYTYDTLGRPLTRTIARNGQTVNDTFGYNNRSELTTATVNGGSYAYDYDNIGNRKTAQEAAEEITGYSANNLNQYTALTVDGDVDFQPEYDADGNQCRVKTSTGIWTVSYDAENRPTDFTKVDSSGSTTIHCEYDYMGRRATKQVSVNGNVTLHQRYLYRGYLQIACIDLTRSHHPALWYITWDPTQPVATRPLALQKDGTWYTYGWDLTKNICELYGPSGYIRTAYTYSPYGQVSSTGDVEQPIQWSSEFNDTELGLIYYNYRHYNPVDGRWNEQEPNAVQKSRMHKNLYSYIENMTIFDADYLGLLSSGVLSASGTSQAISILGYKGRDQQEETNSAYNSDPVIGKSICDRYMEKTSKCCRNSLLVDDPYLPEARTVCKRFVDMYSSNGKLFDKVLCVAECLTKQDKNLFFRSRMFGSKLFSFNSSC